MQQEAIAHNVLHVTKPKPKHNSLTGLSKNNLLKIKKRLNIQKLIIEELILLQYLGFPELLIFLSQFSCAYTTFLILHLGFHRA